MKYIRQQIKLPNVRNAPINIEPTKQGAAIIYRSKIIGLAKNEADKTCYHLKKNNQSCMVMASTNNQKLAMADNN